MLTSAAGVGASPTIATPRALALAGRRPAAARSRRRVRIWFGYRPLPEASARGERRRHAAERRRPGARRRPAVGDHGGARGRRAAAGRSARASRRPCRRCRLIPLGQLRRVHRQRHLRAGAGLVDVPLGPEHLLRLADADRRAHAQVGDVDRRRDPVGLERVHDAVALRRRRAVLALQRRQRRVLAVGRRRRVARRLDRVLQARLVRDRSRAAAAASGSSTPRPRSCSPCGRSGRSRPTRRAPAGARGEQHQRGEGRPEHDGMQSAIGSDRLVRFG